MRFTILGAGGIGAYFGAILARAGHDVTLFARGDHLAAIRRDGLRVRGPDEDFVAPLGATDDVASLPPSDVALVTVKSYSLAEVVPVAKAMAERGATVVPLLNGVTAVPDLIAGGVPADSVVGGIARISAARVAPGLVERRSSFRSIVVGEMGGGSSERTAAIATALGGAGIEARAAENIEVELWQKFVFITALGAVCGLTRSPIGPVREAPGGPKFIERAVNEVVTVARARGIALPADEAPRTTAYIGTLPGAMKPSFLMDLEAGGRTELDILSGAVARFAAEAHLECPVHETVTTVLSVAR